MIARFSLLVLVLILAVNPAVAEPLPTPSYTTDGPELFQAWLKLAGVMPLSIAEALGGEFKPSETILVVWGTEGSLKMQIDWASAARSVLEIGGAVVILSHEPTELGALIAGQPGIRITGESPAGNPPDGVYPISWFDSLKPPFSELMNSAGMTSRPLQKLGTPTPHRLTIRNLAGPLKEPLAYLTDLGWPFAMGGEGPKGNPYRFLVFADQNVFSNAMLLDSNLDNYWLALNTVRFLQGPEKRSRCLFLDHGRVVETFPLEFTTPPLPDVPLPMPGWRQLQTIVTDAGNRMIDRLETQDSMNKSLLGRSAGEQNRRMAGWLQTLGMIAAVFAVLYLLRKVLKARQPQDPVLKSRFSPPISHTLLGRRGEELLRQDNLIELARAAARDLFREAGAPEASGSRAPPIEFSRGRPADLEEQIARLWRLAFGKGLTTMKAERWVDFERTLAAVNQAHENKHWRFAANGNVAT